MVSLMNFLKSKRESNEREKYRCTIRRKYFTLTLFLSTFARTLMRAINFTFVSSSRNTIHEEFFPKECDKLRTHTQAEIYRVK